MLALQFYVLLNGIPELLIGLAVLLVSTSRFEENFLLFPEDFEAREMSEAILVFNLD